MFADPLKETLSKIIIVASSTHAELQGLVVMTTHVFKQSLCLLKFRIRVR